MNWRTERLRHAVDCSTAVTDDDPKRVGSRTGLLYCWHTNMSESHGKGTPGKYGLSGANNVRPTTNRRFPRSPGRSECRQ